MNKNKKYLKITCAILATSLVVGTTSYSVLAKNNTTSYSNKSSKATQVAYEEDDKNTGLLVKCGNACKEETVYVITDPNGTVNKTIVSSWLKNNEDKDTLLDATTLSDITNLKGDETYEQNGNNILWNAAGKDIYYQGTSDKELPILLNITYTLDGKEIAPDKLEGKSGHLAINIKYINKSSKEVNIGDKLTNMYIPFMALSATVLDDEIFHDVTITNGKILNDGSRQAVVGLSFPGMQSNLGITKDIYDVPDEITIEAYVSNYKPITIMTVVSDELFKSINLDELNNTSDLNEKLNLLATSATSLVNGSGALYDGLNTLYTSTDAFTDGVLKLRDGSTALLDGTGKLVDGMNSLTSGTEALTEGITAVDNNSAALIYGASTVFDSMLEEVSSSLATQGINVTLTKDNYVTLLSGIISTLPENSAPWLTLTGTLAKLNSYNEFYQGLIAYTGGVGQVKAGLSDLYAGEESLSAGLNNLYAGNATLTEGLGTLYDNTLALKAGISKLLAGSVELNTGMTKFNEEGIKALVTSISSLDLEGLLARLNTMSDLANSYDNYSGKAEGESGSVKFIYKS